MRKGGFEPPPLTGQDPKSSASTSSATFASIVINYYITNLQIFLEIDFSEFLCSYRYWYSRLSRNRCTKRRFFCKGPLISSQSKILIY